MSEDKEGEVPTAITEDDGKTLDPSYIWVVRSAYLKFKKADWRDPDSIKKFLTSAELQVLTKKNKDKELDLAKVIKFYKESDLSKESIRKLRNYFENRVFKEFKAS